jgi:hypothetical protein
VSDYDKGYRAGVMAERRRAMLVALRATNPYGRPSDEGHSLAHQIGRAGDQIPKPIPDEPEEWTVFGERKLVRDLPSQLESTQTPFTKAGLLHMRRLEDRRYEKGVYQPEVDSRDYNEELRIAYLEEQLADSPARIAELEELVATLSLQLSGIID